jgi:hypothetical protein
VSYGRRFRYEKPRSRLAIAFDKMPKPPWLIALFHFSLFGLAFGILCLVVATIWYVRLSGRNVEHIPFSQVLLVAAGVVLVRVLIRGGNTR